MGDWNDVEGWHQLVALMLARRARRMETGTVTLGTAANRVVRKAAPKGRGPAKAPASLERKRPDGLCCEDRHVSRTSRP